MEKDDVFFFEWDYLSCLHGGGVGRRRVGMGHWEVSWAGMNKGLANHRLELKR
jgi:hypothetical protein